MLELAGFKAVPPYFSYVPFVPSLAGRVMLAFADPMFTELAVMFVTDMPAWICVE